MSKMELENIVAFERYVCEVMEKDNAVGLAVSIVNDKGQTIYENFFGSRDREKELPINENTVFGLASITKSFTSLGIIHLADQGLLKLNDLVCKHIPEFKYEDITISHLLSHSAGFYPKARKCVFDRADQLGLTPEKDGDLAYHKGLFEYAAAKQIQELNEAQRLIGEPGEYFSYSNDSFALASEIIRRISGEKTYTHYFEKYILAPLQMNRSSCKFHWNDPNVSRLYNYRNGKLCGDWAFYEGMSVLPGAGAMKSTISDMRKYLCMYLNHGKIMGSARLVSSRLINEMLKPRNSCDLNKYYGYGLKIKELGDLNVFEHGGDDPGVSSNFAWSYESGLGVVVLCNTSGVTVRTISDMAMLLASGKDTSLMIQNANIVEWDADFIEDVCGTYQSDEGFSISLTWENDKFIAGINGEKTIAYPINSYMILVKGNVADMMVKIYVNDDGRVWALGGGYRIIPKLTKEEKI